MTDPTIRLLALNLQCGIGTTRGYWQYAVTGWKYLLPHGDARIREVAAWISANAIDVATLCEVEGSSWRSGGKDQTEQLRELTPLEYARFFQTHTLGRMIRQGNAVLSAKPLVETRAHRLPGRGEPRHLCEATVDVHGQKLTVFTTHLSLGRDDRHAQIVEVARFMEASPNPAVLTGDFNTDVPSEFAPLTARLISAGTAATFPSWAPRKQLDHVFVTPGLHVTSLRAVHDLAVSDHLGLLLELAFPGT